MASTDVAAKAEDDAIVTKWKGILSHPLDHKWSLLEIVAAIIFSSTVAYLWNLVLKDALEIDKVLKG